MIVLAFDPGISGALCILGPNGVLLLDDLPVHQTQHGRGAKVRAELDLHALCATLAAQDIGHCVIERCGPMPRQGLASTWRFAESFGQLIGVVVARGIAFSLIRPQDWQRYHQIGPATGASLQRAVQLFPTCAPRLSRKRDHHRADSLLLAAYGRARRLNAG
jgi:hypothetical protein